MMKRFTFVLILLSFLFIPLLGLAQVVTSTPAIVQQSSTGIEITFYATQGNKGMVGATECYAHTGVITSNSKSDTDWKYAPSWGNNAAKYKMELVSTNVYKLKIGDIRSYYGITDANETVKKLAFVFRNSNGSKEGKTAAGTDIFVEVYADGLSISLTNSASATVVSPTNNNVTFNVAVTMPSSIKLYLNSTSSEPIATAENATTLSKSYTFSVGDYEIIAQATSAGNTVSQTMPLCCRADSKQQTYNGTLLQGANANADGTVTFCLLAPQKSNVMLVGEWNDYKPTNTGVMNYQGDKCFWTTVSGLDMDKEYGYYFIVDDNLSVSDPYAKLILDPTLDKYINQDAEVYPGLKSFPANVENVQLAVFHGNEAAYNWEVPQIKLPAKQDLMIYEMLFRDFTDEGTVNAAIAKLDYIKGLGVNAVELMPIQEFDGNISWGYNPNFYFAPDKAYGNKAAYKKFIDECHKRGIAVILDVVFNHSFGLHPWCKMYWDATNNRPAADSPFHNAVAPHNWSVGQDWKQENVDVQDYFCDVLKYWINAYKVDGYRFDLAKGLGASSSYASDKDAGKYNSSRISIMKKYTDAIKSANPDAYAIYEYFVDSSEESEMGRYGGMSWNNQVSKFQQAAGGFSSSSSFAGMVDKDGFKVGYMESHDEERNAYFQNTYGSSWIKGNTKVSMARLGSNAAMGLLTPGAKMIWQFEEMGYDVSINDPGRTDPKPTHWEYLDNEYRKGLHDTYAEILTLRRYNPELFSGDGAEYTMTGSDSNWNNGRFIVARNKTAGKELVVAYNPTSASKTLYHTFDSPGATYYINSKTLGTTPTFNSASGTITLAGDSYVVISNMPTGGVDGVVADRAENAISVYPNPVVSTLYISSDEVGNVDVYSITGSLVLSASDTNMVDVSHLANGSYIVKVVANGNIQTAKIIKK